MLEAVLEDWEAHVLPWDIELIIEEPDSGSNSDSEEWTEIKSMVATLFKALRKALCKCKVAHTLHPYTLRNI